MKKAASFIILVVISMGIISLAGCFLFQVDMTGTWSGTITNDAVGQTISGSATLTQNGDSISGTGTFDGQYCTITGTVSGSNFTMDIFISGYIIIASGSVSGNIATGTWNDAEGYYGSFELTRQ